ncbi:MAG: type II toxin-antitoxin system HigB family toxin [bacterium]|nr:type II toxin-antitoxin system HigB family toxin [bacterium]
MRIISRRALREFWERHPDARGSLDAWYADVKRADWEKPSDIKSIYANASLIGDDRVVFNVNGNRFRLVVLVRYQYKMVYIRFVGTHQDYDKIDVATV